MLLRRSLGWEGRVCAKVTAHSRLVFLTPHQPQTLTAACQHLLGPKSHQKGLGTCSLRGKREEAAAPAVLVVRALPAMVHMGIRRVLGDLVQGEDAAPLTEGMALPKPAVLGELAWHELSFPWGTQWSCRERRKGGQKHLAWPWHQPWNISGSQLETEGVKMGPQLHEVSCTVGKVKLFPSPEPV